MQVDYAGLDVFIVTLAGIQAALYSHAPGVLHLEILPLHLFIIYLKAFVA